MRCFLVALAAVLVLPTSASAAEVHVEGTTVVYTAAPGEANAFVGSMNRLEGDSNTYYVDDGAPITVGAGCEVEEFYSYKRCKLSGPGTMRVDLGDGADSGELQAPGTLSGGSGEDKLKGSAAGPQTIDGGEGNDELDGDGGLYCNAGPQDPFAPDELIGGPGTDRVTYDRNGGSMTISIDGQANDGLAGENDNVHTDVENITADDVCGGATHTVTGSDGPNELVVRGVARGLGGNDVIKAQGTLDGGPGNDQLIGQGDSNDTLTGGDGDDYLEGGFGDDTIDGGAGKDSYVGDTTASNTIGVGNDTINARDGVAESVACGPGSDKATVDATDDVAIDTQNLCEEVDRAAATTPSGPGNAGPKFVFVASTPVKVSKRKAKVKVTCLVATGCNGKLTVTLKTRKLASKAFSIAPKKAARVTLRFSKATLKKLKRSQTVLITATSKPAGSVVSVSLKLKR